MTDTLLIAGNQVGLERDVEPFLLPEGAYPLLENAFVFRERVKRRRGFNFHGRLRRIFEEEALTQTTTAGATTTITDLINDASIGSRTTEPDAEIEPGSVTITVNDGNNTEWNDSALDGTLTSVAGSANGGTIDYFTGQIVLNFSPNDAGGNTINVTFNYFPSLPVMGLRTRENTTTNLEQTIAWDTKYAYEFLSGAWQEFIIGTTWNGTNSQFFWTTNWRGASAATILFFTTNFNQSNGGGDPIRYTDGATWTTFNPAFDNPVTERLQQCRILIPFKGRLLALNTWEGATLGAATNFSNRLRFSQVGDPTDLTNGWRSDIAGRGGFIDAQTKEAIIGAGFIKDRLIVYFERSTYQIVYTGNEILPFVFQQINTELGAESTFSTWEFDNGILGVGNVGVHTCNGVNVQRIDDQIPDEVFKIQNDNEGPERVYAIRDYQNELVFWTYPQFDKYNDNNSNQEYPNRVLVYNYKNNSWGKFIDSFTCYGYFQNPDDATWATLPYDSWNSWSVPWSGGQIQSAYPTIIAGNQQGFTFLFDQSVSNDQSLTIKALSASGSQVTVQSPDHNLDVGQFVSFSDILGATISPLIASDETFEVQTIVDNDNFRVNGTLSGTYVGAGRITVHPNFRVATKRFNPYLKEASEIRLEGINFLLDTTDEGEFEAQLLINSNTSIDIPVFTPFGVLRQPSLPPNRNTNVIRTRPEANIPFQAGQEKIWHDQFYSGRGEFIQITMTLSPTQMKTLAIINSEWTLHALLLKVNKSGRLIT